MESLDRGEAFQREGAAHVKVKQNERAGRLLFTCSLHAYAHMVLMKNECG